MDILLLYIIIVCCCCALLLLLSYYCYLLLFVIIARWNEHKTWVVPHPSICELLKAKKYPSISIAYKTSDDCDGSYGHVWEGWQPNMGRSIYWSSEFVHRGICPWICLVPSDCFIWLNWAETFASWVCCKSYWACTNLWINFMWGSGEDWELGSENFKCLLSRKSCRSWYDKNNMIYGVLVATGGEMLYINSPCWTQVSDGIPESKAWNITNHESCHKLLYQLYAKFPCRLTHQLYEPHLGFIPTPQIHHIFFEWWKHQASHRLPYEVSPGPFIVHQPLRHLPLGEQPPYLAGRALRQWFPQWRGISWQLLLEVGQVRGAHQ